MNAVARFEIKKLHGYKHIDLRFVDNTLILVGENGAGKTTVLNLFYYLLSGQWPLMAKYDFEEVLLTVGQKTYKLRSSDIKRPLHEIDHRFLERLPPALRHRVFMLMQDREGALVTPELEVLCHEYGVPLEYLLRELDVGHDRSGKRTEPLRQISEAIKESLDVQILFLPTYRRIEHELNLIFKGLDDRELKSRRELLTSRRGDQTYVKLIEFGMKDVENAINGTLSQLNKFARESLNNLTFGYLGDIVEEQYATVDLNAIREANDQTIDNILNRIQEHILSSKNKQHLRQIIEAVKTSEKQSEHAKVICHYFTKLMAFQNDIEAKESQITSFCAVCNDYMVDKKFKYDISNFSFTIRSNTDQNPSKEIKLHHHSRPN